jgi:hypothetical protein
MSAQGYNKTHLLAREFGGNNSLENLVPMYREANVQHALNQMAGVEDQVGAALRAKQTVYFQAIPVYDGPNPYVPTSIEITWGTAATGLRDVTVNNQKIPLASLTNSSHAGWSGPCRSSANR